MQYVTDYFWVVVCKNRRFHHKGNIGYEHHIVLGGTDAFDSLPMLPDRIQVRCDLCGEEYSYKQDEVLRDVVQVPETLVPHPLFRGPSSNGMPTASKRADGSLPTLQRTVLGRIRDKISNVFSH